MKERTPGEIEFIKGVCLGILLAGIVVSAFILIRFGTLGSRGRQEGAAVLTASGTRRKLEAVRDIIAEDYLNEVHADQLESWLFKGIAAGLDDSYAAYYSPEEMEEVARINTGSYRGIGVVFIYREEDHACLVSRVYEDSPAMRAGIQEGDVLVQVGETDVTGLDFETAVDLIRTSDETVELVLLRDGEEIRTNLVFEDILLTKVTAEMLSDRIGCIRISEFDEVTVDQFRDALEDLKQKGMEALILDVRDNPGGLLTSVTSMLDDLMDAKLLVTTRTRTGTEEKIYSDEKQLFSGPISVLTNENSASASEVFAGVLQYYGMADVTGSTTYGKGVVQSTFSFKDGSAFKLTTEKYLIAGEVDIDGTGITPDYPVDEADAEAEEDTVLEAAAARLEKEAA